MNANTKKRMTKSAAVAKIANILARLRPDVDADEVCAEAIDLAVFYEAYDDHAAYWPKHNAERAAGEIEGVEEGAPPLTWEEFLRWSDEFGEWNLAEWGIPDEPGKE